MRHRAVILPILLCVLLLGVPIAGSERGGLRPAEVGRDGGRGDADAARGGRERPRRVEPGVFTAAETADTPEPTGARLYNVVFAKRVADPKRATLALAGELGFKPTHVYRNLFQGFAGKMTPEQARRLAKDRRIEDIQAARTYYRVAQEVPAGIRRVNATRNPMADIDGNDERVDVDVMVIDGLVDRHPDLNVFRRSDCVDGTIPAVGDEHGTHVAGTIGAKDNDAGVVGVAPGARIWSVNVFEDDAASDSWIACALDMAAANDVEVANMSLGGDDIDGVGGCRENILHDAVCRAVAAGVTVVVAAGNDGIDARLNEPANYDEVITVSALNDADGTPANDRLAGFSNYGADVDIAAPGVNIRSTAPGGGLASLQGTSMAAPHVAGAAALYLAEHPNATPAQVRSALLDRRQAVALAGDPDGIDEGVLDVASLNTKAPNPDPGPDPGLDTTPPTVAITSPQANARVRQLFTVTVSASDAGSGMAAVELFECSFACRSVASDATAPYAVKVRGPRGAYLLMVRAFDNAGNVAESERVPVTIQPPKKKR